MRAIYLGIALIVLSPCLFASLNSILKIQRNGWLMTAGMISAICLVMVGIILTRSRKTGS